jgi:hypothetical protein
VRVLCQIVDGQLLAQIERYLKQAVVDKSPVVAASVLVSAVHLIKNVSSSCMRRQQQLHAAGESSSGTWASVSTARVARAAAAAGAMRGQQQATKHCRTAQAAVAGDGRQAGAQQLQTLQQCRMGRHLQQLFLADALYAVACHSLLHGLSRGPAQQGC